MTPEPNRPDQSERPKLGPASRGLLLIKREINTYRRELPRLLAEGHEGRFVLIKGDEIVSVWDTFDDAIQAGCERFGLETFIAQPIDTRDLTRVLPKELDPDGAV